MKKAKALAEGMLLNARGNSGVILSQLFFGMANYLKDIDVVDVKSFGEALKSGVKQAYSSVVKPVEGTMLTVAREASDFAYENSSSSSTFGSFFTDYLRKNEKKLIFLLDKFTRDCYIRWQVITCNIKTRE